MNTASQTSTISTPSTSSTPSTAPIAITSIEVGDIVATASDGKASGGIRWATSADFSHAILCLRNGLAVDAIPGHGVTTAVLARKLVGVSRAAVFRHRTANIEQKALAASWAAAQVGKDYDSAGAARVGLEPGSRTHFLRYTPYGHWLTIADEVPGYVSEAWHDTSFFCSELIFRAFEVAQAPIIERRPHTTGPGALIKVSTVQYLGNVELVS